MKNSTKALLLFCGLAFLNMANAQQKQTQTQTYEDGLCTCDPVGSSCYLGNNDKQNCAAENGTGRCENGAPNNDFDYCKAAITTAMKPL